MTSVTSCCRYVPSEACDRAQDSHTSVPPTPATADQPATRPPTPDLHPPTPAANHAAARTTLYTGMEGNTFFMCMFFVFLM